MKQNLPEKKLYAQDIKTILLIVVLSLALGGFVWQAYLGSKQDKENRRTDCVSMCNAKGHKSSYCSARCESFFDRSKSAPEEEPGCMAECMRHRKDKLSCRRSCTY